MNFTEYVENEKKKARLKNIEEVRENIDTIDVKEKIKKHVEAFDGIMTEEEVRDGILNNIIIASKFCVDPGRQNISEKLASQVLGIKKLPAYGKNCIRFDSKGNIISQKIDGATKSADFMLDDYYATQKYTKENGGAQDNQKTDVRDFLLKGSQQHKVAAILDGDYWDVQRPLLIKEFENNPNVLITSVTELSENI